MPSAEDWSAVVAVLRRAPTPSTSRELPRLYALALEDGPRLLRSSGGASVMIGSSI